MHTCRITDIRSGILSQLFKTSKVWHWCLSVNYKSGKDYLDRMYPQEPDNLVRVRKIQQKVAAAISFDGGVKGQFAL